MKDKIKKVLKDWECDIRADILDVLYLDSFLKENGITLDCLYFELVSLYNMFSEECWSAAWEDNAEGQFIEWLKEKEII